MVWSPQIGPQADAISATWANELLYGGARGGGKSDFLLGDFLQDVQKYGDTWRGILFRRTYKQLDEIIQRSKQLYPSTGARFLESKDKYYWIWENGARLVFRHLESSKDTDEYQGHQYTWIGFDELTHWADDIGYRKLLACNRSAHDVPTKRVRATANPTGVGHSWVKERFVDPAPLGYKAIEQEFGGIKTYKLFIPAKLQDNKILMENDPSYIANLHQVGSKELVRAWLDGDWDVQLGSFFSSLTRKVHGVPPFPIPKHWLKFRSMDWGYSKPFSVGWWTVSDGEIVKLIDERGNKVKRSFPVGALIRYREWYGASGANKGLRLENKEIARGILKRELQDEEITYGHAGTDMFDRSKNNGISIAEEMAEEGVIWEPAKTDRISGWQQVRSRLKGVEIEKGHYLPMLYAFNTCDAWFRLMSMQQHDERRAEDLDTNGEDHIADETRYGCMSRPWVSSKPQVASIEDFKRENVVRDSWKPNTRGVEDESRY